MRRVMHRLLGVSIAMVACGCAHTPWADDPSSEPPNACAALQPLQPRRPHQEPTNAIVRGQTFYCLGLFAPAVALLSDPAPGQYGVSTAAAAAAPPTPPADRATALRWLVYVHRRFPDWERIVDVAGERAGADLDRPELADVRDDLRLLAGRVEYRNERFDEALALLRTIPASSPLHVRAALLEGAVHIQTAAPELALAAFGEALRAAGADRDPKRARALAAISLARTHYSMGQLEAASRDYQAVSPTSAYGIPAALEGALTQFQLKDHTRARALLQSLEERSADVPPETMGRAMLLGATIALQEKNYRETQEIIARFNQVVPAVFLQAQRLAGYEAAALFDLGFSVRTGGALTPPLGAGRTLLLLTDVPVARRFAELDELSREEATLNALGEDWKNRNDDAPSQLYDRRGVAAFELGELLQRRLQRLVESLAEQIGEANHIEFEALQLEKASLKRWW